MIIPPEVREELLAADAPSIVKAWADHLPNWIEVHTLDALATERQPSLLLIDERAGAAIARSLGMLVTGSLGVLNEAARRKLISLPDAIDRLKQTSFRYPKAIVARLLEEDARRA